MREITIQWPHDISLKEGQVVRVNDHPYVFRSQLSRNVVKIVRKDED